MLSEGFGDLRASEEAQKADAGVSEGGHVLGRRAALNATGVLAEHCVANPMQLVFDTPMTAPPIQQLVGRSLTARNAGDRVLHFDRVLTSPPDRSREAADLGDARPVETRRQAGGSFQPAMFAPPMSLVARLRSVECPQALCFTGRGKKRAEIQLRERPSIRADFP